MTSASLAKRISSVISVSGTSGTTDVTVDSSRAVRRRLFPGWPGAGIRPYGARAARS